MPEHLRHQVHWDPIIYASENNPIMNVNLYGSLKQIDILIEMWLEVFNSLLHLIENITSSGYSCYHKLSLNHLVIINNRFELRDGVPLVKASKATYGRDFFGGAEVFEEILNNVHGPGAMEKLPDLKLLVNKMKDNKAPKGYPLLVDPSLMPLHNRGPATVDIYNFLKFEMPKKFREELLEGLTCADKWDSIADTNDLLSKWLKSGPIYLKEEKTADDFIEYLRVCYSHILDFRRILYNKYSKRIQMLQTKKYSKRHANLVIYGSYRLTLSELYSELWRRRKLRSLNPHLYFRYRQ